MTAHDHAMGGIILVRRRAPIVWDLMKRLSETALEHLAILIAACATWPARTAPEEYEKIRDFLLEAGLTPPSMEYRPGHRREAATRVHRWLLNYLIELNRRESHGVHLPQRIEDLIIIRLLSDFRIRDRAAATLEPYLELLGIAVIRDRPDSLDFRRLQQPTQSARVVDTTAQHDEPLETTMIVECTECRAFVEAREHGGFEYVRRGDRPAGRFVLLSCGKCVSPILVHQINIGNLAEGDIWDTATRLYPAEGQRSNPNAPKEIQAAL